MISELHFLINVHFFDFRQAKLGNGNYGRMGKGVMNNFPIKLPATLLAECTVEISNVPKTNTL